MLNAIHRDAVKGSHEFVVGVERHFRKPWVGPPCLFSIDPQLRCEDDQGSFSRVTYHGPVVVDDRVAVE